MRIDPRTLRLFLAVCREGTISGAARAEHLSQPSVSVAINQLERVLSAKLFERTRQGIILTEAGEALKIKAQAVDSLLISAQEELRLLADNIGGPLHIAGTPGALSAVVGRVISSFSAQYPKFRLKITECHDETAHRLLSGYEVDIAILTAGLNNTPDNFNELPVFTDPFSLIVGPANAHLPDVITLPDLEAARWLFPDKIGGFRRQIQALFINSGAKLPRNVICTDSLLTTKQILRASDYIALLPREVVKYELQCGSLRAIQIEGVSFSRQVGLFWLSDRRMSVIANAFIEHTSQLLNVSR